MKLALSNPEGEVFTLSPDLREAGLRQSRESPRRRMLLPIHRRQDALVQRMVNFLQPGTYVRPHLHPLDSASETILTLEGAIGFVIFGEDGHPTSRHRLEAGGLIDIEPGVWHTLFALAPDTLILEVKRGPYDDSDKSFAPWAPDEGSPEAEALVRRWEQEFAAGE